MQQLHSIYSQIYDYENLYLSYLEARKSKRYRSEVLKFSHHLEENLIDIQNSLIHKTYRVGRYREFFVHEPKKRLIMALPFRDRVVQWAVYRHLNPFYDKMFIDDSYACRKGMGTHTAADRLQYWIRRMDRQPGTPYYLQLDISKYFYRIDHEVLLNILRQRIKDPDLMWLLSLIIRSEHTKFGIPLGDHDFERGRIDDIGMPIGNLLSQLFANLYLNELDQFAKHELRIRRYIRYMDDVTILHTDKKMLSYYLDEVNRFVEEELGLTLNNKTVIRPVWTGIEFVGFRIWPTHRKMKKKSAKKMRSRLKYLQKAYSRGEVTLDEIKSSIMSYIGHLQHADTYKLLTKTMKNFVLKKSR